MQWSHSRVEAAEKCPFKYKLRYLDGLTALMPDTERNPAYCNALVLGTALHTGLEKGVGAAIDQYYGAFPIITDAHITEAMKLEVLVIKARGLLEREVELYDGARLEFEVELSDDDFVGYADLLMSLGDIDGVEWYDLYDFKYTSNGNNYRASPQLHLYKWAFERLNPKKRIRNMYYLIVPKVTVKQGQREETAEHRKRVIEQPNAKARREN